MACGATSSRVRGCLSKTAPAAQLLWPAVVEVGHRQVGGQHARVALWQLVDARGALQPSRVGLHLRQHVWVSLCIS